MSGLPSYISAITYAGALGIFGSTCVALYRGALGVGLGRAVAVRLSGGAAALFLGWAAASGVAAERGWYQGKIGQQVPWLPIAVLAFVGTLMAAARIPVVAQVLAAAEMPRRLTVPHAFRVAELTFLVVMGLGKLPALFSVPAGLGDVATGLAAPFVVARLAKGDGRRAGLWFNGLGILDLVVALSLGGLIQFGVVNVAPNASVLGDLPMALIPTAAVPVLLVLHFTSISGLRRAPASGPASAADPAAVARGRNRIVLPDAR